MSEKSKPTKFISVKLIKQYVTEAVEAYITQQKSRPADPSYSGHMHSELPGPDLVVAKISKEQSDLDQSKSEIIERLQKIRYPYGSANEAAGRKTLYQHLLDRGILDLLLEPPLFFNIRMVWSFQKTYDIKTGLFKRKKSQYEIPIRVHRQILRELVRHLHRLDKLACHSDVPKDWFSKNREQILSDILREAAVCYPKILVPPQLATPIRPHADKIGDQMMLFEEITRALATRIIKSDKLAYHLVACLYSPLSIVRTGKLAPYPASVSKTIRDAREKEEEDKAKVAKNLS